MPIAPFAPRPVPRELEASRARLAIIAAVIGIAAALVALAVSPGVRHAVGHAERSVRHAVGTAVDHAVDKVFPDQLPKAKALPTIVLTGAPTTVATLKGRPALVTFWSASCATCATGAAALESTARSVSNARVVGVAYGGDRATDLAFIAQARWSFPNLLDATGSVTRHYGIAKAADLPVTVVVNAKGRIAKTLHGPQSAAQLAAALRATESNTR